MGGPSDTTVSLLPDLALGTPCVRIRRSSSLNKTDNPIKPDND